MERGLFLLICNNGSPFFVQNGKIGYGLVLLFGNLFLNGLEHREAVFEIKLVDQGPEWLTVSKCLENNLTSEPFCQQLKTDNLVSKLNDSIHSCKDFDLAEHLTDWEIDDAHFRALLTNVAPLGKPFPILTFLNDVPYFVNYGQLGQGISLNFGFVNYDDIFIPELCFNIKIIHLRTRWVADFAMETTFNPELALKYQPEVKSLAKALNKAIQEKIEFDFSTILAGWKKQDTNFSFSLG